MLTGGSNTIPKMMAMLLLDVAWGPGTSGLI
jgi:hypothetical protein